MLELLIGFAVTAVVGRCIFKGHSPTGMLMLGGVLLLAVAVWQEQPVLPDKVEATGLVLTDIVEFIKHLLSNRSADLGLMIMVLCGFAAYMAHIGANDMVVKLAARPLEVIKSPYVLMVSRVFRRLRHVAGSVIGLRSGRVADGDAVPVDGRHGH
ncbi:hypothetical protein [Laribacter hongkongensis]|uniref:hypothetical protein n=1 Tax=Laribacter hongkongensis TaxID=168471 RepID=UPI001EFEB54A|nr:hypothetical protein [Laribacter hongkongensis]